MDLQAAGPVAALPRPRGRREAGASSRTLSWSWARRRRTSSATSRRSGARYTPARAQGARAAPCATPPAPRCASRPRRSLPPVDVVDMREELKGGNRSHLQPLAAARPAPGAGARRAGHPLPQPPWQRRLHAVPRLRLRAPVQRLRHRPRLPPAPRPRRRARSSACCATSATAAAALTTAAPCAAALRLRPMGLGVEAVEEAVHEMLPGGAHPALGPRRHARPPRPRADPRRASSKGEADVLDRHADGRQGPRPARRDHRRGDQRRHRPAHPGLSLRRAHVPAPDPGRGPRRPRRRPATAGPPPRSRRGADLHAGQLRHRRRGAARLRTRSSSRRSSCAARRRTRPSSGWRASSTRTPTRSTACSRRSAWSTPLRADIAAARPARRRASSARRRRTCRSGTGAIAGRSRCAPPTRRSSCATSRCRRAG